MGKIFEVDFRTGSVNDKVSNVQGSLTLAGDDGIARTEKGLALRIRNILTYLDYVKDFDFNQDWSISIDSKSLATVDGVSWDKLVGFDTGWSTGMSIFMNRVLFYYTDATLGFLSIVPTIAYNKWIQLIVTHDVTNKTMLAYVDGVASGSLVYTKTLKSTSDSIHLAANASREHIGEKSRVIIYDHVLTEKERAKLYSEFLNASPITKTIR